MMLPAHDLYRSVSRPVITDLLEDQLVRRWLNNRRIVTYMTRGEGSKALIDRWGEAMLEVAAVWPSHLPYLSLHDLPIRREHFAYVQYWLDWVEASNSHLYGRMALVAPVQSQDLLRDVIEHPTLETEVFATYREALAWLKTSL